MTWGPQQSDAAILVTFDNFGEAFDIQRGRWPDDATPGTHHMPHRILPDLMDMLGHAGLKTTWFVEGCNARLYPDQLRALNTAGHEIAIHGWQHETWAEQTAENRPGILHNCIEAFRTLGIRPTGFRPPGGAITPDTTRIMYQLGLEYVSPLGTDISRQNGVDIYPFQWRDVDALYFEPWLDQARQQVFGDIRLKSPADWAAALDATIDRCLNRKSCHVMVFHPYLLGTDGRMDILRSFLDRLSRHPAIWTPRMADFHRWHNRAEMALP